MADAFVVPFKPRSFAGSMAVGILGRKIPLERSGAGYLSGSFPDGVTSVDGAPVAATVRVLVRSPGKQADGFVVVETQSLADGTWLVDGLPTRLKYDVIGRKNGFNDVIMANVSPAAE